MRKSGASFSAIARRTGRNRNAVSQYCRQKRFRARTLRERIAKAVRKLRARFPWKKNISATPVALELGMSCSYIRKIMKTTGIGRSKKKWSLLNHLRQTIASIPSC